MQFTKERRRHTRSLTPLRYLAWATCTLPVANGLMLSRIMPNLLVCLLFPPPFPLPVTGLSVEGLGSQTFCGLSRSAPKKYFFSRLATNMTRVFRSILFALF